MANIDNEHDHGSLGDHEHQHDHDPHNWESADYVADWAKGQDRKEANRAQAFQVLADTIPYEKSQPIRILDLGAGYGALTKFLLESFPNATSLCQDGSEEMAKLGRERMSELVNRFDYVVCNFSRRAWTLIRR